MLSRSPGGVYPQHPWRHPQLSLYIPPFLFPLHSSYNLPSVSCPSPFFPLEVGPLNPARGSGRVPLAGSGAEPHPKLNLVHFSCKIWHLIAACSFNDFPESTYQSSWFKQYYSGVDHTFFCSKQEKLSESVNINIKNLGFLEKVIRTSYMFKRTQWQSLSNTSLRSRPVRFYARVTVYFLTFTYFLCVLPLRFYIKYTYSWAVKLIKASLFLLRTPP